MCRPTSLSGGMVLLTFLMKQLSVLTYSLSNNPYKSHLHRKDETDINGN